MVIPALEDILHNILGSAEVSRWDALRANLVKGLALSVNVCVDAVIPVTLVCATHVNYIGDAIGIWFVRLILKAVILSSIFLAELLDYCQ